MAANDDHEESIATVTRFLRAIEAGDAEAFDRLVHPKATFHQWPNAIYPSGGTVDVERARLGFQQGKKLMAKQAYEVDKAVARGNVVALEVTWKGTLAIPWKTLPAGTTTVAHVAMFVELEHGLVKAQRNYDCYEPF